MHFCTIKLFNFFDKNFIEIMKNVFQFKIFQKDKVFGFQFSIKVWQPKMRKLSKVDSKTRTNCENNICKMFRL